MSDAIRPGYKVTAGNHGTLRALSLHSSLFKSAKECCIKPFSEGVHDRRMPTLATRAQISKRRSTRIALNTAVGLSGLDTEKCPFTTPAKATNLNRYGAAIHLPRQLLIGSTVMVRNARGTQLSARVVAQLGGSQGLFIYGIEFVEKDDAATSFWGITFPTLGAPGAGIQAAEQVGIARRKRGMPSLQS